MDLWVFLTVAVVVWGVVELVQARTKNKIQKQLESGEDMKKKYGEKIVSLERRIANLEAIVVDEDAVKPGSGPSGQGATGTDEVYERHQPGTMSNKLR